MAATALVTVTPVSDLLLRRGRIVPLSATGVVPASGGPTDRPVDVLVRDGVVVATGPDLERPAGVREVDAGGRWVVPGLWDQHVHLAQWTLASQRLDLASATSPEDVTRAVHIIHEEG